MRYKLQHSARGNPTLHFKSSNGVVHGVIYGAPRNRLPWSIMLFCGRREIEIDANVLHAATFEDAVAMARTVANLGDLYIRPTTTSVRTTSWHRRPNVWTPERRWAR